MQDNQADYTNTFLYIWWHEDIPNTKIYQNERFQNWLSIWKERVSSQTWGVELAQTSMKQYNPLYIPRNHLVEEALDMAISWNYEAFHEFLNLLKNPYRYRDTTKKYMKSLDWFDEKYQTFCGT
jgi:uncharacterized protein YdiU (UPF0061 family)